MKKIVTVAAFASLMASTITASAADLPARQIVKPGPAPAAGCFWSGAYVGAHVGYTFARASNNALGLTGAPVGTLSHDKFTGGGFAGYNACLGSSLVVGLEADVTKYGNAKTFSQTVGTTGFGLGYDANWGGSIRARIGLPFDRFLVYATGGIAGVQQKGFGVVRNLTTGANTIESSSKFGIGYVVGVGAEYAMSPNWLVRAEYLYTDAGNLKFSGNGRMGGDFHTIRLGLGYKF
jgi:outer membrane immunogenic protein